MYHRLTTDVFFRTLRSLRISQTLHHFHTCRGLRVRDRERARRCGWEDGPQESEWDEEKDQVKLPGRSKNVLELKGKHCILDGTLKVNMDDEERDNGMLKESW